MTTFDFVTSMSRQYYDRIGHKLVESFLTYFPDNYQLHVWTEDGIPIHPRVIQHNLADNEFYQKFTLKCTKKSKGRKKIQKMSIKVGVQYEASKILTGDVLVWLDADVQIKNKVTEAFFNTVRPIQLANYMGQENNQGPETGFISYNRHHEHFNTFMQRFVDVYYSNKIYELKTPFDTGAWWETSKTFLTTHFYSLSGNSKFSHVFHISKLRFWLQHQKGSQKKTYKFANTRSTQAP